VAGPSRPAIARAPVCRTGAFGLVVGISPNVRPRRSNGRSWVLQVRRRDSESSVDDLGTWRGVVLGRAVTTLRSVETQPYAWGFVLSVRRDPTHTHGISRCTFFVTLPCSSSSSPTYGRRCARRSVRGGGSDDAACTSVDAHDGRTRGTARHGTYEKERKKIIRYVRPSMRTMVVRSEFFFSLKSNSDIQEAATGLCLVRLKKEFFATYGRDGRA
jgi:hypothetical protein